MKDTLGFDFDRLLEESVRTHGHLCPGQVLGVRMSLCGLRAIGVRDPRGSDRKSLIVLVEIDRCATDAIQSVTGCSLGKRTLKFLDYGKMAATFVNLKTGKAVRVFAREDAKAKAAVCVPDAPDKYSAQVRAYRTMPDSELFTFFKTRVELRPEDMPGRPLTRVVCSSCGEHVQDGREVRNGGAFFCKPCAKGAVEFPRGRTRMDSVMQKCYNDLQIRSKVWLEKDGEPVFGRGRMFLLTEIEKCGSINQAANSVNISYRKAWSYISAMESRLGISLVDRRTGGRHGGGAGLTVQAKEFLRHYERLDREVTDLADGKFDEILGGGFHG